MKILCAFCKYNYGSPARGIGTEFEAFLPALRRLGHEVLHFETWDPQLYPDYRALNHALLREVERERPDVLLTIHRDYEIWAETLEQVRSLNTVALVTWTTDDSFKFPKVSRFIAPLYDVVSTTYAYRMADYKAEGFDGAFLTQWAANSQWLEQPQLAVECQYPVSFVGARYGYRGEMIARLVEEGIEVACFGHGWPNGPVETEEIPRIMRDSVISLNFSGGFLKPEPGGRDRQIKARTFEVPGAGGFLLTEAAPGLGEFFQVGDEISTFEDFEELLARVRFFLSNPEERDRVARNGHRRTRECHTYDNRFAELLEFTAERFKMRQEGTRALAVAPLPAPRQGLLLSTLRGGMLAVCKRVWGPDRGVRAARRITFEASLKLVGPRTFTAAGLPGRLFPFV